MRKTPVLWLFLMLLIILMYSAYGSNTLTSEAHNSQKQPKDAVMMVESRKAENERSNNVNIGAGLLHVVQHTTTIKRAKAVYGGANDNRHPRGRNSANSLSINNHTSFFMPLMAALLLVCFF